MSGLQIGKSIKNILKDYKVFPLIADEGTTFPFIVYRRSSLLPSNTKDIYNYKELATLEVIIAASSYNQSINIAEEVRAKLEHNIGSYNGINIGEIKVIDASEEYLEDSFIQKLTIQIEII